MSQTTGEIDWQDIRLVCGEGKLSASDVLKAVNIILRQRASRPPPNPQGHQDDLTFI